MSYEYMMGLGALGSNGGSKRRRSGGGKGGRRRPNPKALMEKACGETCTNEALPKTGAIKKSLPTYEQGMAKATSDGCEFACESDELAFLCCPEGWSGFRRPGQRGGQRDAQQQAPIEEEMVVVEDEELFDPSALPPVPADEGGSSLGVIAVLGVLGLGVVGIAAYFLLRGDDDEEEEDEDEFEDEDEE